MTTDTAPSSIQETFDHELPLDSISLTGWNPRREFDEDSMEELKASIEEKGVLQPVLVRPDGDGAYQLVAGERRYRASLELGRPAIPAVIRELSDRETKEIMLLENIQRQDLNPLEEARAIRGVIDEGVLQEELARKIGKSQSWISNRLRILQVCEKDATLEKLIISREISPRHILLLVPYIDYPVYEKISKNIADTYADDGDLSVSDLERSIVYAVTNDWHHEYTLEIPTDEDEVPWNLEEYGKHLDFKECQKCEHVRSFKDDEDSIYCLNRPCYKAKLNKAKIAMEKEAERLVDASRGDDGEISVEKVIDAGKLKYGDYERLDVSWTTFDTTDCETCKHRRITTKDEVICLNLKCYRGKKSAHTRKKNKEKREETRRILDILHDRVYEECCVSNQTLRHIIERYAGSHNKEDIAPLETYGGIKDGERQKTVREIPNDELEQALLKLLIWKEVPHGEYGGTPTEEKLQEAILKVVGE